MADNQKSNLAEIEESILETWKREKTFELSMKQREGEKVFSFYDGPPFANGLPHFGHSLVTAIKDSVLRYKTMQGFSVPRRNGWDCHGLPVEYAIEKEFGVSGKKQILELGLEKFNAACRDSIFKYKGEWEVLLQRLGRWSEYENYYATVDANYTESVWWALAQVNKKGLLYRGYKSTAYCPRCETPLSNFEVNDGYKDDVPDPSLFVKFKLKVANDSLKFTPNLTAKIIAGQKNVTYRLEPKNLQVGDTAELVTRHSESETDQFGYAKITKVRKIKLADIPIDEPGHETYQTKELQLQAYRDYYGEDISLETIFTVYDFELQDIDETYLLGWTTTPWSLPGNAAIAVNPKEKYVFVKLKNDDGIEEVLVLAQKRLEALSSDDYTITKEVLGSELVGRAYEPLFEVEEAKKYEFKDNLYKVWAADFVSIEDGSGVLHVAPAFGEDDLVLGQANDIPVLQTVDASGKIKGEIGFDEVEGKFFKGADKHIIEHLTKKNRVYAAETFTHTYPFCWRCETPLLYYAISSWFIRVSDIRSDLLKTAEEINWVPENIKKGRFGKWLEGARDWSISRNRYWGAPMPIWQNVDDPEDYIVVESYEQLRELAGDENLNLEDVHRPFIDEVEFTKDGKTYKRIEEVLDCWFESGCMSIGQQHYPFENEDTFNQTFPADFIIEGLDQTRLWFYVQHVMATILFDSPAYKNVVVNGMIMAADGQKLSKRLKNYPPVEEVFNNEGADSLRLFLLSSTQATQTADYMRFNRDGMKDLNRNVLGTLMNSQRFFKMYADIDGWKPAKAGEQPESTSVLDQWMLARVNETIHEVTRQADDYKLAHAIQPIFSLIDDMSNWFIRRSRRRFWKSEDDDDKNQAYETLWFTLIRVCQLLAPWAPFLSDHIWRELVEGTDMPNSVHLSDWPKPGLVSGDLLAQMKATRGLINHGLSLRAEAKVKVRQPLASISVTVTEKLKNSTQLISIISDELNVKEVKFLDSPASIDGSESFLENILQRLSDDPDLVKLDTEITPALKREGLMREVVRNVQSARKAAGLNVEDRIVLSLTTESDELQKAIEEHADTIKTETLATELTEATDGFESSAKIEDAQLEISLKKAL